jgi:hypothetical protein
MESVTLRASYACFQIGVDNRDYHYLSQPEIANAKRILTTLILDQDTSVTSFPIGRRCAQNLIFHSDDPTL